MSIGQTVIGYGTLAFNKAGAARHWQGNDLDQTNLGKTAIRNAIWITLAPTVNSCLGAVDLGHALYQTIKIAPAIVETVKEQRASGDVNASYWQSLIGEVHAREIDKIVVRGLKRIAVATPFFLDQSLGLGGFGFGAVTIASHTYNAFNPRYFSELIQKAENWPLGGDKKVETLSQKDIRQLKLGQAASALLDGTLPISQFHHYLIPFEQQAAPARADGAGPAAAKNSSDDDSDGVLSAADKGLESDNDDA